MLLAFTFQIFQTPVNVSKWFLWINAWEWLTSGKVQIPLGKCLRSSFIQESRNPSVIYSCTTSPTSSYFFMKLITQAQLDHHLPTSDSPREKMGNCPCNVLPSSRGERPSWPSVSALSEDASLGWILREILFHFSIQFLLKRVFLMSCFSHVIDHLFFLDLLSTRHFW